MILGHVLSPWRRSWRQQWGTRPDELTAALPGDDLIAEPTWRSTHAISIDAPPEQVWPWVAQVGQERGGFYSFERLENLFGCRITNADRIVDEWQAPVVGQVVHIHPEAPELHVATVEPGSTLVLRGAGDDDPAPATDNLWAFHVLPDGPGRCRLVERSCTVHGSSLSQRLFLGTPLIEPVGFVMGREMLRGIKARAEASVDGPPMPAEASRPRGLLARAFARDLRRAGLAPMSNDDRIVTEDDLAGLPEAVQRYFRGMGVVGRRRVTSFEVSFRGRFRMRPDGPWMRATAVQHNTVAPVGRVFTMVLWFVGVLPMIGGDTYLSGTGRMLGKLAGLVTVADGSGPEFDTGELSTWLNDAVLLAPSMLLTAPVTWEAVDDRTIRVGLSDGGRTVHATFRIDGSGRPTDYWTTDRWADLPGGPVQAEWRTPVPGWTGGPGDAPMPLPGGATWMLEDGPFTYVEGGFVPGSRRIDPPAPS